MFGKQELSMASVINDIDGGEDGKSQEEKTTVATRIPKMREAYPGEMRTHIQVYYINGYSI